MFPGRSTHISRSQKPPLDSTAPQSKSPRIGYQRRSFKMTVELPVVYPTCEQAQVPGIDGHQAPEPLTEAQKEHFVTHGWLHLSHCFTKEQADWVAKDVWTRLGMDPENKMTWAAKAHMPAHRTFDAADLAPKAWAAITEICGGEDRITESSRQWRDTLIVNLGTEENEGKDVDPRDLDGWHVDGDFFVHYLDSPEQALLVVPLFTEVVPGGGGTMICPEAIPKVAKHLYEHPEGVSPHMVPRGEARFSEEFGSTFFQDVARICNEFVEVCGQPGDVFLLHPLMLHSMSTNHLRKVRIITNPPVHFREAQCFDRPDGQYSLVEQTTLRALGKHSLVGWKITAEREKRTPKRLEIQAKLKEEEVQRLANSTKTQVPAA